MKQFYVYILESETNGMIYIGQTSDPDKRLADHNRGASPFTRNKGPWHRIFLASFQSRAQAIHLEKTLKAWKSPKKVRAWINTQVQSVG